MFLQRTRSLKSTIILRTKAKKTVLLCNEASSVAFILFWRLIVGKRISKNCGTGQLCTSLLCVLREMRAHSKLFFLVLHTWVLIMLRFSFSFVSKQPLICAICRILWIYTFPNCFRAGDNVVNRVMSIFFKILRISRLSRHNPVLEAGPSVLFPSVPDAVIGFVCVYVSVLLHQLLDEDGTRPGKCDLILLCF